MAEDEGKSARKIVKAVIGAGAGAVVTAKALLSGADPATAAMIGSGTNAATGELVDHMLSGLENEARRRELAANADELEDAVSAPLARGVPEDDVLRDFASLLRQWAKASDRSMGRKKRILMAALQRSLRADPEEYAQGLGLQILEALQGLDYGDVLVLRAAVERPIEVAKHNRAAKSAGRPRRSTGVQFQNGEAHHGARLVTAGLLRGTSVEGALVDVKVTWFGRKVLEYVQDGLVEDIAKEEREAEE